MKRIAAFVFAFFAVCYLQMADADAQFVRECRSYGFCVPGGGPTGTPVSNGCISTPGTTITFTAQGTGGANPNRISVVTINWSSAGSSELTAVTIGGISMTRAVRATTSLVGNNSEIWYVANPTGTSSNIVLTASIALTGATIEVYSLIGYHTVVATTIGTTSVSQTYTNKQLAIAAGNRATNVSTSLSNMTNDFSSACGLGLWGVHASQPLKGNGTLTSTISPTSNSPEIALAVWATSQPTCSQATAFLARTSGLDAAHIINYQILICGLVADGIWPKFDVLRIYATQNSATAILNLVSSSYTGTIIGSPTFTADRGFTGVDQSFLIYIDSGFNPAGAPSPNFTRNSNHLATWTLNTTGMNAPELGYQSDAGGTSVAQIYTKYIGDSNTYIRPQTVGSTAGAGILSPKTGMMGANRSSSTQVDGYHNGASFYSASISSTAIANFSIGELSTNNANTFSGCGSQQSMASWGSSLTSTDWANYNTRVRTYMTAVGVP